MSQFIMIESRHSLDLPLGVSLMPLGTTADSLFRSVAEEYFHDLGACWFAVSRSGTAEPLIDDAWEAQRVGRDLGTTAFAVLAQRLIRDRTAFICWSGGDFRDLPRVTTWSEFLAQLAEQTTEQPADFFVCFDPDRPAVQAVQGQ